MAKTRIGSRKLTAVFISVTMASGVIASMPLAAAASLDEIIVTARKREVTLQDAPVAVSVTSGADFDKSNISRLDNFNGYVPGLVVAKNDGAGRVVTIRGLGWETAQNLSTQPSVLTYIDGIYLANPLSMGLDLGDIERIEVFRGPQGTEFGQGTTGGAINIVTRKPVLGQKFGDIEIGIGNYNARKGRASFNVPIGDRAALRLSAQAHSRDGFAEITGGDLEGYDLDDASSRTAKFALQMNPNDRWSILLAGFFHTSDQNAAAQKNIDDPNPDPRELTQDFPGIFELDNTSVSLIVSYESPSGLVFKSLSGWQKLEKDQSVDGDRLTEGSVAIDRLGFFSPDNWDVLTYWDNDSDAFSQEFNVSYSGDKLDWVTGIYYLDHDNFNDFLEATGPAPFSVWETALANPSPDTLPPFASVLNFNEARTVARQDTAIYTQATYRVTDRIALTGGLRYQDEEQRDFGEQFFGIFGGFDRSTSDEKTTWKFGVDFKLSDDNLIYGLISTGWKNGGINPGAITGGAIFAPVAFPGEEVTSFEIGSRNTFADDTVRFNITAFLYDHENMQYVFEDPVPFAGGTGTIPELDEYGIESDFSLQMSDNWRLDGMVAWQDGEIKSDTFALDAIDFREALAPGVGLFTGPGFDERFRLATTTNLNGNEPAKMPDIVSRIAVSNQLQMSEGFLSSRLEWVHRGEMQARVFNHPAFDTVPSYDIVNLYFSYQMEDRPMSLSLSASNVLDEDGINNIFNNPFGIWSTSNEYIPPREVMVLFKYTWE